MNVTSQIKEHMDVISSDKKTVGKVDHMRVRRSVWTSVLALSSTRSKFSSANDTLSVSRCNSSESSGVNVSFSIDMAFFDDRLAMPDRYGNDHAHTVEYGIRCVKMDPLIVLTTMGMCLNNSPARCAEVPVP